MPARSCLGVLGAAAVLFTGAACPEGARATAALRTQPAQRAPAGGGSRSRPEMVLQLGHSDPVNSLAFSPCPEGARQVLASGGADCTVKVWNSTTGELARTIAGFATAVEAVDFSPDGRTLVTGHGDGTVRLMDPRTGRTRKRVPPPDAHGELWEVKAVAFSPCPEGTRGGRLLCVASGTPSAALLEGAKPSGEVRLWEERQGFGPPLGGEGAAGSPGMPLAVAFSPDGKLLAVGESDGSLAVFDPAGARLGRKISGHTGAVNAVAFAPRRRPEGHPGSRQDPLRRVPLASAGDDGSVKLWDAQTGELSRTFAGHGGPVEAIAISPDGKTLASGGADGRAKLWDTASGALRRDIAADERQVRCVRFSPDGGTLATAGDDRNVRLWDVREASGDKGRVRILSAYSNDMNAILFTPDGATLVTGNEDGIRLWDARAGRLLRILRGHTNEIWSVALSSAPVEDPGPGVRRLLASGSDDRTMRLWDLATGEQIGTPKEHPDEINVVSFSPDGRTVASGAEDGQVRLWDVRTGRLQRALSGHTAGIWATPFSPDGKTLLSAGDDKTIRLWDPASPPGPGALRQTLAGHEKGVTCAVFSADGRNLASGSRDATLRLWDARSWTLKHVLRGPPFTVRSIAFSPDGRTLAAAWGEHGTSGVVLLWDVAGPTYGGCPARAPRLRRTLAGHHQQIRSIAFSPDGRILASGSDDRTTRLWNASSGELVATLLSLPPAWPASATTDWIAFTPEGFYSATDGARRFIRWRVPAGAGWSLQAAAVYEPVFHRPDRVRRALRP